MLGLSQSRGPKLFGREIIFEEFQPMCCWYLNVTDRRTDGRTDRQTDGRLTVALPRSALASRGKNETHPPANTCEPVGSTFRTVDRWTVPDIWHNGCYRIGLALRYAILFASFPPPTRICDYLHFYVVLFSASWLYSKRILISTAFGAVRMLSKQDIGFERLQLQLSRRSQEVWL